MTLDAHVYVFCYDIERDKTRRRVSSILEDRLVRVQDSVFEGFVTAPTAKRLFDAVCAELADGDRLRVYCLDRAGVKRSLSFGGAPFPEEQGYYLL